MANRTETLKRIAYYKELRDSTLEALKALTANGEIESYVFSDSNGQQNVRRRKIDELRKALADYETQIDSLERSVQGGGVRTFSTNRYG